MKSKPASAADAANAPGLPPGLRSYLYFTAACTGAAIMVVEILGAKMLSPYLGTSHFVWTAQIAVTLVALAAGYYAGGRLVERTTNVGALYWAIVLAALYLTVTVALCQPVAFACVKASLPVGSLLTSGFLFFVPLSLLAMVGPFFVRILTSNVQQVGGTVGRLTAVSTLGSFAGTVAIGYVLIPFLPNSITMYTMALGLMLLGVIYAVRWGRQSTRWPALIACVLAGATVGGSSLGLARIDTQNERELFRGNSNFGLLQVLQNKFSTRRLYLNDFLVQNTFDIESKKSVSMFTYMLHGLARSYVPELKEVLCIGLGVGIVPMNFAREGVRTDVVEINPAVIPVGQEFFNLEPARLNLFVGDGRQYVNQCSRQYDAIILDAFLGDSNPSHLMTREAFTAMRRILKPDGALVINTFAGFQRGEDFFCASLYKTLTNVFPSVRVHNAQDANTLFVASGREKLEFVHPPELSEVHSNCLFQVREAFDTLREPDPRHGRVLTDDFNPVEYYDAANRERTRRSLARWFGSM